MALVFFVDFASTYVVTDQARSVLPHLLQFTDRHREEGLLVQQRLLQFEEELKDSVNEIWAKPPDEEPIDSRTFRMKEAEKDKRINPVEKVPKPELAGLNDWNIKLLDFGQA